MRSKLSDTLFVKNKNAAQYTISASCDLSPLETEEVKPVDPAWIYVCSGITFIHPKNVQPEPPSPGDPNVSALTGTNSWTTKVSAPYAGQWKLTFTASVTYYVWDKKKEEYVLNEDGTKATFGPYTGTSESAFKATNGKFKIILVPNDKCKETSEKRRSVTQFGLGEIGEIKVEAIDPNDAVEMTDVTSSLPNVCEIVTQMAPEYFFRIKQKPGDATITVKADVKTANGGTTPGEETYDLTAIAPTGMFATSKENKDVTLVGAGMYLQIRFEPKDVSFSKSKLGEGYVEGEINGTVRKHPPNKWRLGPGDVENGTMTATYFADGAFWGGNSLNFPADSLTWEIPFGYYENDNDEQPVEIMKNTQTFTFDGEGGCIVTKFGKKATRVPNNVPNLLNVANRDPDNIIPSYHDGWKYID
jgi:hypothetical protein